MSTIRHRGLAVLAMLVMAALVAGACGSSEGSGGDDAAPATGPSGTLRFGNSTPVVSFDPQSQTGGGSTDIVFFRPVFDTLLDTSAADGTIKPSLATEWAVDGTVYTFTLREGVTFTDGTAFDATVVKAQVERGIEMAKAQGRTPTTSSVEAPDATTVIITLVEPSATYLGTLGGKPGMIMSLASQSAADADRVPQGSGPYVLASYEDGVKAVYDLNPDYWNEDAQKLEHIEISVLSEPSTRLNALRSGEIDATVLEPEVAAGLNDSDGVELVTVSRQFYGIMIRDRDGTKVPALGEVKVRQAIAYSIDREGFISAVAQGFGTPSTQIAAPTSPYYDEELDETFSFDPDKAKRLMAEAGYADGFDVTIPAATTTATFATAVLGFFQEIGINATVVTLDPGQQASLPVSADWPIIVANFPNEVLEIGSLITGTPGSPGVLNPYKVEEPDLMGLVEQANNAATAEERVPILTKLNAELTTQGVLAVAAQKDAIAAHTDKVTNVEWRAGDPTPNILTMQMT